VSDELLQDLYDLAKCGPTSMNCLPGRFLFLRTPQAKARLEPALMAGNVEKVRTAPVTVIVAYDTRFYEHLAELWPHSRRPRHVSNSPGVSGVTAFATAPAGAYLSSPPAPSVWTLAPCRPRQRQVGRGFFGRAVQVN
jgi:3-hydroxypropanoate dehydrogenase